MKWSKKNISVPDITEGKALACLSYLFIIGPIIAYFKNKQLNNSFVNYSIKQQVILYIIAFLSYYFLEIYYMNILMIVGLTLFLFWGYGLMNVSKGRVVNIFGFVDRQGDRRRLRLFPVLGLLALPFSFLFYDNSFCSRYFDFDYFLFNLDLVMKESNEDAMYIIACVVILSLLGLMIDNSRIKKLILFQKIEATKEFEVEIGASQKVDNSESSTHSS